MSAESVRSAEAHLQEAFAGFGEFESKVADVFTVGVDLETRDHVYHYAHGADEIVVYDGRTLVHREQLDGRTVDEWFAYVAECECGWLRKGQLSGVGRRVDRARKAGDDE